MASARLSMVLDYQHWRFVRSLVLISSCVGSSCQRLDLVVSPKLERAHSEGAHQSRHAVGLGACPTLSVARGVGGLSDGGVCLTQSHARSVGGRRDRGARPTWSHACRVGGRSEGGQCLHA
eukprot:3454700-Rhodomonas_salina.1